MVAKTRGRVSRRRHPDEMTDAEEQALREREAQKYLGISAAEFVRRWQAGEYEGVDTPELVRVAMLFPFGR